MNTLFAILLFQLSYLPARSAIENPVATFEIPKNLKKDFDKAWTRFVADQTVRDDAKVAKDFEKLLKKKKDFDPALVAMAYIDLYAGRNSEAERKLVQVLERNPKHALVLSYLSELAFTRDDYARASELYARLLAVDKTRTDVEDKRQKSLLLATDGLLRAASAAEQENRLSEAEALYLEALKIAPQEPVLHAQVGTLLIRQKKWEDALKHFRREAELGGVNEENQKHLAEALMNLGRTEEARGVLDRLRDVGSGDTKLEAQVKELEDLGRWGKDIQYFQSIESSASITREQLAATIIRYFPQITEFQQNPQIVTDTQDSWASPEIQAVVGVGVIDVFPNHTFQPSLLISRGDLAVSMARLFRLLGLSTEGSDATLPVPDLISNNAVYYRDVQLVLSQHLMKLDSSGGFAIDARVSGEEAIRAVEQLLQRMHSSAG